MKGNIGPSIKNIDTNALPNDRLKAFSKLAEEFDIDNIIPKDYQKKDQSAGLERRDSAQSFDLSIKNYEMDSNLGYSEDGRAPGRGGGNL